MGLGGGGAGLLTTGGLAFFDPGRRKGLFCAWTKLPVKAIKNKQVLQKYTLKGGGEDFSSGFEVLSIYP